MLKEKKIEVGKYKLRIIKIISEGAYGFVYLVEDRKNKSKKMALKISISQNEERYNLAKKELDFLKENSQKENNFFIQYIDSKIEKMNPEKYRFFVLLEYGQYGTLFNLIESREEKKEKLKEEELIKITKAINNGLKKLHSTNHVHCDIKIENLLFYNMNLIKMCDFGSINTYNIDFNTISKNDLEKFLEEFEKQTTFMYRPPEMCDPYLKYRVNSKVDMWMLGCVLFTLMFFKHPFLNSSKLGIINASYFWPEKNIYSKKLENLVRNLLTPDPALRYSAKDLEDILHKWDDLEGLKLNSMARNIYSQHDRRNMGKRKKDCGEFDFSGLNKIAHRKNSNNKVVKNNNNNYGNNFPNQKNNNNFVNQDIFNDQNNTITFKDTENNFDFGFSSEKNINQNKKKFDLQKKDNFDAFNDFNDNFEVQKNDYQKYNKNYNRKKTPKKTSRKNTNNSQNTNNNEIEQQLDSLTIQKKNSNSNSNNNNQKKSEEFMNFINELDKDVIGEKKENDFNNKADVNLDNPDFLSF